MNDSESTKTTRGLTKKQEAFAQAVITENSLSDAYRSAYDCSGMTGKTINESASREAKHPKITARVAELRDRLEKAADVTLERWMREQARIAFLDVRDLYNDDGSLKPLSEMTEDARVCIASIDIEKRFSGSGDDREVFIVKKVKLHNKTAALESIGRALGVFEKDNRQKLDIVPLLASKPDWVTVDAEIA